MSYKFPADFILILHFLYILFVLGGGMLIWAGKFRKWQWVRNFWFRIVHLGSIAFVAIISLLGIPCPLTILENSLRQKAGQGFYNQSFIQYWLHKILFYDFPLEVFTAIYAILAIMVATSFYFVPVKGSRKNSFTF